MVKLQEKDAVFSVIMRELYDQRRNKHLCDFTIIVNHKQIPAHKCILVAGSEYFKSLFLGPLKQDLAEVDLTDISDDFDIVVSVIDFLYTGEISVDDKNLEGIMKLSSFLLITLLRDMCTFYMKLNLDLDRCIHYYLLSVDYMVPELEQKLSKTIPSRFHDCLIFRDSSLSVSPTHLRFLMNSCNIFHYCCPSDIISFIVDWVEAGMSEEHENVGCEVLDFISLSGDNCWFKDKPSTAFDEKLQSLRDSKITGFSKKLDILVAKCPSGAVEEAVHVDTSMSPDLMLREEEVSSTDTESVLIAFTPKQCLIYYIEGNVSTRGNFRLSKGDSAFDICVYIPRKKTWYFLAEGYRKQVFKKMFQREADVPFSCLMEDKICYVSPDIPTLCMFNLKSCTWDKMSFEELAEVYESYYVQSDDVYVIFSEKKDIYLILRNKSKPEAEHMFVFFNCYRLSSENNWILLFSTQTVEANFLEYDNQFSAHISKTGAEMIIVFVCEKPHTFVVDLHSVETSETGVCYLPADIKCSHLFSVLEYDDHFLILEDVSSGREQHEFLCRVRYKLNSKELSTDHLTEISFDVFDNDSKYMFAESSPCEYFLRSPGKRCVWVFEGNGRFGSSLKCMSFEDKDKLIVSSHTPPPFSCVTDVVVGDVKQDILKSLSPIRTYLHGQSKDEFSDEYSIDFMSCFSSDEVTSSDDDTDED